MFILQAWVESIPCGLLQIPTICGTSNPSQAETNTKQVTQTYSGTMTGGVKAETCNIGDSGLEIRLEMLFEANPVEERRGSGKERASHEGAVTSYNK